MALKNNVTFIEQRPVWNNSTFTEEVHPLTYLKPQNRQELEHCLTIAFARRLHIRAVGSGHSFSDAPLTDDILVDTEELDKVLPPYAYASREAHLVEVEAGIKVHKLNKELDKMGLSIPAMGGYNGQAIAGAIMTGTHGSSLKFGAMSQMVRSIVLVTNDLDAPGKVRSYRIEPQNGITDPQRYPATEPTLLQDDDLFNSVVVSFGAMGLVYSMLLEVGPTYYLKEVREVSDWTSTKLRLHNGLLQQHDSVFVQINPYETPGKETTLIMTHDRVNELDVAARIREDIKYGISSFNSAIRNPLLLIAGHFKFTYNLLVNRMNRKPERIGRLLTSAIKAQRDRSYVNKAHKVMFQGAAHLKLNAYDSEVAIPLSSNYLGTIDELLDMLRIWHKEYRSHLSSPVNLRFVKGSSTFMTPEHGRDVCYIDMPVLRHAYGNSNIVARVQRFLKQKGGIPHWGKRNEEFNKKDLAAHYPRLDDWRAICAQFNHQKVFSNKFTRRMVGV